MDVDVRLVMMSAPDRETGVRLIETLVRERHAACGSVLPGAVSVYWWQGALERAEEAVVLLKTTDGASRRLVARAAELHPYDVPELLVLPVEHGLADYLEWVGEEVRANPLD